mmetsp:Transcript_39542/g.73721  ORF Transcript_39542/g.73721 Transcript_39542/m.73721 type:complete len:332 (+) Transcript_39542:50-1045(+)
MARCLRAPLPLAFALSIACSQMRLFAAAQEGAGGAAGALFERLKDSLDEAGAVSGEIQNELEERLTSGVQNNRSTGVIEEELIHRFDQLKESIDQSDEELDPDLQGNLTKIENQLKELRKGKEDLKGAQEMFDRTRKDLDQTDNAWSATCFAMATETLGGRLTKDLMTALEKLVADDLPPAQAAQMPLFRMVNVCIRKRTEGGATAELALELLKQVMASMKRGKHPPKMPTEWVELSNSEEAYQQVRDQSQRLWKMMKFQADIAVKNNHWTKKGPPAFFLVFALPLPLYYLGDWLWRKFRSGKKEVDPPKEKEEKQEKDGTPSKKESKKAK